MNEDFVPFEILCKLREKGYSCKQPRYEGHVYDVLKWLREEKGIFVLVDIQVDLRWYYEAWHIKNRLLPFGDDKYNRYDDYEAAALAGIENVLDNLI